VGFQFDDMGAGWPVEITLPRPGQHTLVLDSHKAENRLPGLGQWNAGRVEWPTGDCYLYAGGDYTGFVSPVTDLESPNPGPPGSLEDLIADLDLEDPAEPLLPVAFLFAATDLPPIDRMYLSPNTRLEFVEVKLEGSCIEVHTSYTLQPEVASAFVNQGVGCSSGRDGGSVLVPDPVWEVTVGATSREEAESFAAGLVPVRRTVVPEISPGEINFDPDRVIDARKQKYEAEEIIRLSWGGGRVAVMKSSLRGCCESYADPIVATPVWFNPGATGRECRDHSLIHQSDGRRGFLLVVVEDASLEARLELTAGSVEVPLHTAAGGRAAGIIDLPGGGPPDIIPLVRFISPDGSEVPCIQN
jgi:hypothetical protein